MVQDDPESPERTSGSHDDEPRSRAASRAGAGLHRRQLLTAGGLLLTSCTAGTRAERVHPARLDQLFEAHAEVLPEAVGAGANHYPMAAEALEALGYEAAIDESWIAGAALYSGELGRVRPLVDEAQRVGRV